MTKRRKDPAVYVWDMLHEIAFVEKVLTQGNLYDDLISRAVLRAFTVLGEAAKRVDDETQANWPTVPWREMIALRNVLSHDYEHINLQQIERVVQQHFPTLKGALQTMYHELTGEAFVDAS